MSLRVALVRHEAISHIIGDCLVEKRTLLAMTEGEK
jgi:hypothetical protein